MNGNGRDVILARVREALAIPSDPLVRSGHGHEGAPSGEGGKDFSQWLPPVGESFESRTALFAELSEKLSTQFLVVANEVEAHQALAQLSADLSWTAVASHADPMNESACASLGLPVTWTQDGYDRDALEAADASITTCEALIAQTGSVLITTHCGGRALSVLPPHHVVLAKADQLLPDLPSGYALLRSKYEGQWPSFMSLISGPSRTGDIERILVLGAHGPKKLTVILIQP